MNTLKKYPLFRRLMLHNFTSTMGDSMYYIALMTYAAQFENAALAIALVTLSESIPGLFYIVTGSMADMSNRKTEKTLVGGVIRGLIYLVVGIIIGFKASMPILAGIVLLNFISDLIGKYTGGLMTPFALFLVDGEDLEEAQGLNGAMANLVAIIAQFVGAFLMGIFSYRVLAWLNSGTFLLAMLILYTMKTALKKIETEKIAPNQVKEPISLKAIWQQIITSLKEIKRKPNVFQPILLFAIANGGLAVIAPLLSLYLKENSTLIIRDFPFTLAFYQGMLGIGVIFGSLFGPKLFKKQSLFFLCQGCFLALAAIGLSMLSGVKLLVMASFACVGILAGSANPKLSSLILTNFSVEKLGTVSGGVNTLLLLMPPVGTTLFTAIAAVRLDYGIIALISFGVVCFLINWLTRKRKPVELKNT